MAGGGLFSDLPAAKGEKPDGNEPPTSAVPQNQSGKKEEEETKPKPKGAPLFVPTSARKKPKPSTSFSKAVGTAGTSMAFVPTHLKRKRPPAKPATSTASCSGTLAPALVTNSTPSMSTPLSTSFVASTSSQPVNIHESTENSSNKVDKNPTNAPEVPSTSPKSPPHTASDLHTTNTPSSSALEISDPYDPRVPNDLLQYWDRKNLERERYRMEQEAKQALEEQRLLRQQLDEERRKLQESGQLGELAARQGRGRGVSNLPAWLVKQQQDALTAKGDREDCDVASV